MSPLYDFRCECGYETTRITTPRERLLECPKCRETIKREFPRGQAARFRGPGFYETDYRRRETR